MEIKMVPFMGTELMGVRDEDGQVWAGVRWMCEGIGLSEGQTKNERLKIRNDKVLSAAGRNFVLPTKGGNQEGLCLKLNAIPLWLAKISITPKMEEEKPQLADRLEQYQLKAQDALAAAFLPAEKKMLVAPKDYPAALRALADSYEENQKLSETVEVQRQAIADFQPIKQYVDKILSSTRSMTTTQIAADYDISAQKLNKILHEEGIQRKVGGQWILYQKYMGKGFTKSRTIQITRSDGRDDSVVQTEWSQKGRLFIHEILTRRGIVAVMDKEMSA